jgi:hypothetical protein
VAAFLGGGGEKGMGAEVVAGLFVRVSARAGEVALRIGKVRVDSDGVEGGEGGGVLDEETISMGKEVADECRLMGGTLQAVGEMIEACLSDEIIKSKYVPFPSPLSFLPHPFAPPN